jgi:hypothetical protein
MPTEHQQGHSAEYESQAHKFIATKDTRLLTAMTFHDEDKARKWLGAWNEIGENEQVRDHFVSEIQRLQK